MTMTVGQLKKKLEKLDLDDDVEIMDGNGDSLYELRLKRSGFGDYLIIE